MAKKITAKVVKQPDVIGYNHGVGTTITGAKTIYKPQHEDRHIDELFERE